MSLRWRLALISSFVTLCSLAALLIGSGIAFERSRLRDLDDELAVQARVVIDDVLSGAEELSPEVSDALRTATGSSAAWVYRGGQLVFGDGVDAPEPLDADFLKSFSARQHCSCGDWRVYNLRVGNLTVQTGRPLEVLSLVSQSYWRVGSAAALLAALAAGIVITVAVNRVTEPLERLARRVQHLEGDAPIPALELRDEVGSLARALSESLESLKRTRARETRFLADAAHELRTPVTALLTDLEHHATRARSAEDDRAVLERARRTARHLRDLASNLLTISQTGREAGKLNGAEVDLFSLAGDVADRLAPLAAAKGLEISVDGEPVSVRGDPVALERAVENLIGNAIKFTDSGGISIAVRVSEQRAILEVADTGVGMNADALTTVFEPFERGGETRREGSGLGLAVVKAVVAAHGGSVKLEPRAPHGLTATLMLPRA